MSKIIGVTVGTQLPKPNFKQNDPTKGDYIKNKPDFDGLKSKVEQIEVTVDNIQKNAYDDTAIREFISTNTSDIDSLEELVGNIKVATQIDNAIADYETKSDASAKLIEAKTYADTKEQKIYKQNTEPTGAQEGALWLDMDDHGATSGSGISGGVTSEEWIFELEDGSIVTKQVVVMV